MMHHSQSNSFSMFFPMQCYDRSYYHDEQHDMYPFDSSVDCTLSLGTPSTRLSEDHDEKRRGNNNSSPCMSNLCWDFLQNKHACAPQAHKSGRGNNSSGSSNSVNDPLVARRCANCDTTSTPLWRNGPRGPKSLCNACGIRYKKEERRANAANANANNNSAAMGAMEQQYVMDNSWYNYSQTQKMPCYSSAIGNEFRFIDDNSRDSDSSIPFFSWIADRPTSLVHDFTR